VREIKGKMKERERESEGEGENKRERECVSFVEENSLIRHFSIFRTTTMSA